jgi:hypothetical protein
MITSYRARPSPVARELQSAFFEPEGGSPMRKMFAALISLTPFVIVACSDPTPGDAEEILASADHAEADGPADGPPDPADPTDPAGPGGLEACGHCVLQGSTEECHALAAECIASSECVEVATCISECGLTTACASQCAGGASPHTIELLQGLWTCASTSPCAKVCLGDGGGGGGDGDPGGQNACSSCAWSASQDECSKFTAACTATPGCLTIATCASGCTDLACIDACFVGDEAAQRAAEDLARCAVCDVCTDVCPQLACGQ